MCTTWWVDRKVPLNVFYFKVTSNQVMVKQETIALCTFVKACIEFALSGVMDLADAYYKIGYKGYYFFQNKGNIQNEKKLLTSLRKCDRTFYTSIPYFNV